MPRSLRIFRHATGVERGMMERTQAASTRATKWALVVALVRTSPTPTIPREKTRGRRQEAGDGSAERWPPPRLPPNHPTVGTLPLGGESTQRSTILPCDALLVAHTMREWTGGGTKATSKCANDGEGPWKRALRYARLRCPAAADGSRARNIEATRWPSAFNSVKKKRNDAHRGLPDESSKRPS